MKNKIFKLLSVVMALAMVFTMFACVASAEEATAQDVIVDGVISPALASGTVSGLPLDKCVQENAKRLYTVNTYEVAAHADVIVGEGCRVYVQFFKEDGAYIGGSGWKSAGNYVISTLDYAKGAKFFKITFATEGDAAVPPVDGLKITQNADFDPDAPTEPEEPEVPEIPAPESPEPAETHEMAQGNIIADKKGEIQTNNTERIHTKDLLLIDNYTGAVVGEGYKAWFHVYDATGTWIGHIGKWTTGKAVVRMADLKKINEKAVYFRAAVGLTVAGNLAVADFPADGLKFILPVNPVMTQGNIIADKKGEIQANNTERIHTADLIPLADYTYLTIGEGYKTWLHVYDVEGNWIGHIGKWTTGKASVTMAELMKIDAKAVYFRAAVGLTVAGNLAAADFPAGALKLYQAPAPVLPEFTQGTIDKGTIYVASKDRVHTTTAFGIGDYERITIAPGYKVYINYYNDEDVWVNNFGSWKEGTIKIADIKKAADKTAVSYRLVIGEVANAEITPETIPADVAKLYVLGSSGACVEHDIREYTSNNDAKCLEDGTKTGLCSVCGEAVTIADEFSATGHKFTDDADVDCDVCGEARVAQDACEHKYGKYTSNNDATCTLDGTKSATCLICGNVDIVAEENTAKGHTVEYVYNEDATCTEDGTQTGICSVCNEEITVPVANSAKGHVYDGMDDFDCNVCFEERQTYNYFASEARLGGADNNDGLTAETAVATVNKVIDLAIAAGATDGDIVHVDVSGIVGFGKADTTDIPGLDLNKHDVITRHKFLLILESEDGTATLKFGNNIRMGGPTIFENVKINNDKTWQYFAFGGNSFTFNGDFARNEIDGSFGQGTVALDVRKETTINMNGYMRKFSIGNVYNDVNFYENYNINFTHMNENPGIGYYVCLGGIQSGSTIIHKALNIVNTSNEIFEFAKGAGLVLKENAFFNFINVNSDITVDYATMGLSAETAAKTWAINANNMATINPTDVAGEFEVEMGYIAKAESATGDVVYSNGGKLVIPAGEYTVSFDLCNEHVYDDDYDPDCNLCCAIREVEERCEHVWGEYVFDEGSANCVSLGTETRTCTLCFITETREIEGEAPGHAWTEFEPNNDATCEKVGTETRTCANCDATETRDVEGEAPGHVYGEDLFCTVCGKYQNLEPTLVKVKGVWKLYENGVWNTEIDTLHKLAGKWFLIKGGIWKPTTGLEEYKGKTFYVVGGKWNSNVTDLKKVDGKWYYIQYGKWNKSIDTLHKINGKWFLIKKGMWNKTTGLVEYKGKTFLVKGGKWDSSVNTLYKKGTKLYAIKSGKVYTGKVIMSYNGKKYYCNKGYAQTSYSGKVTIGKKTYTVKKGIVK